MLACSRACAFCGKGEIGDDVSCLSACVYCILAKAAWFLAPALIAL